MTWAWDEASSTSAFSSSSSFDIARRCTAVGLASLSLCLLLAACADGALEQDVNGIVTAAPQPTEDPSTSSVPEEPPVASSDSGTPPGRSPGTPSPSPGGTSPTPTPQPAPGTAVVNGSVAGVSIAPAHASAIVVREPIFGLVDRVVISIQTVAGFCADYANGVDRAGSRSLVIAILSLPGSTVETATYAIGAAKPSSGGPNPFGVYTSSARVLSYDAQCTTTIAPSAEKAISGSITLTQLGAGVSGTFTLDFPNGGQLSGSLSADVCSAPGAATFTCTP